MESVRKFQKWTFHYEYFIKKPPISLQGKFAENKDKDVFKKSLE